MSIAVLILSCMAVSAVAASLLTDYNDRWTK